MSNKHTNLAPANIPREGWAEIIRNEIETNGQSENMTPDVFEDDIEDWTW